MAYMSQENKKRLAPQIKKVLKKYGVKGSIGVDGYSTLVVNLKSGKLDIIGNHNKIIEDENKVTAEFGGQQGQISTDNYIQVNEYRLKDSYNNKVLKFLKELKSAMMIGNHDNSDSHTDFFDIGWYLSINVGKWNKGYVYKDL